MYFNFNLRNFVILRQMSCGHCVEHLSYTSRNLELPQTYTESLSLDPEIKKVQAVNVHATCSTRLHTTLLESKEFKRLVQTSQWSPAGATGLPISVENCGIMF